MVGTGKKAFLASRRASSSQEWTKRDSLKREDEDRPILTLAASSSLKTNNRRRSSDDIEFDNDQNTNKKEAPQAYPSGCLLPICCWYSYNGSRDRPLHELMKLYDDWVGEVLEKRPLHELMMLYGSENYRRSSSHLVDEQTASTGDTKGNLLEFSAAEEPAANCDRNQQERLEARLQQESTRASESTRESEFSAALTSARAEIDDADRRERENVRALQAELAAEKKGTREAEQNLLRVQQEADEKIPALSSGPGRPAASNPNDDGSNASSSEDDACTPVARKPGTPARGSLPQQALRTMPNDGSQQVARLHEEVARLHEQLASLKFELGSAILSGNTKGAELQKLQREKDIFEQTCEDREALQNELKKMKQTCQAQEALLSAEQHIREGLQNELKKTKRKHDDLVAEIAALNEGKIVASDKDRQVIERELREARRKVEDLTTELLESRKSSEKAKGDLEKQKQENLNLRKELLESRKSGEKAKGDREKQNQENQTEIKVLGAEKDRVVELESCCTHVEHFFFNCHNALSGQVSWFKWFMRVGIVHGVSTPVPSD